MNPDTRSAYNLIAEDWHRDHQTDDWWVPGVDAFSAFLKPGDTVLDVGCGGGTKSRYLVGKGFRVTGIDNAENMVAIAAREVPEGEFRVLDLREVDTLPGRFSGIFAQAVLLHIPKKEISSILEKFRRKLSSTGYLHISVKEQKEGQAEEEMKRESDSANPYERFFSYFTLPELEQQLRARGFSIVWRDVLASGSTRWIQIIARAPAA